jgi:hypothetical protein
MAFRANVSPLEEFTTRVLALVVEQPDLTLVETVAELRRIRTSRTSLWRFLDRHGTILKKSPIGTSAVPLNTSCSYERASLKRVQSPARHLAVRLPASHMTVGGFDREHRRRGGSPDHWREQRDRP